MQIDSGSRLHLVIDGVFDGTAGVAGGRVSFVPNRGQRPPSAARAGILDGKPVLLSPTKEADGPFWTSRYEAVQ